MSYCWYFTQDDINDRTPSREEGISLASEARYRRDGARFIINASNTLGLRYDTMATGVVFFHRFFMVQSFKQFDRWVVGAACLLLAGKVEETPKKCKDILKVTRSLLNDQQMSGFGSNPKEELLTHERILLQTVKFDLQLEHPYSYLLKFAKELKGEKPKIEKLVQMAWTFVNDSLCTTLCLQWEPQAIAVAFLYLAGKLTKFDLQGLSQSKSRSWWRQFVDTLDFHDLESICHQVLDIYGERESNRKKSESANEEVEPVTRQQTPPTNTATQPLPPTGGMVPTTPTQGQLLAVQQQHRYPGNHHSPSPVPPPTLGAAPRAVAPPTCTVSVIQPPAQPALQQSQITYIVAPQAYNLTNPLQAVRPATNPAQQVQVGVATNTGLALPQLPGQTTSALSYSTLGVSVGNTTALPRAPMIQQSFSQLPGQQHYPQTAVLGNQATQKSLPVSANTSTLQGTLRTGTATSYQLLPGVVAGTGIQTVVMPQTGTGIGIGTGTQVAGSLRAVQPGLTQTQQQVAAVGQVQGSYLTPPPAKRASYDLSSYRVTPGTGVVGSSLLPQNLAAAAGTAGLNVAQQLGKPPSLLPQTTNTLTMTRLPSLMTQQPNSLYRSNSLPQTGAQLTAVTLSQLPGGGGVVGQPQQVSALSAMTQISGQRVGGVGSVTGSLPGQLHSVMGAAAAGGGTPIRSALPQPQPSPTARPPSVYGLQQQSFGGSGGRGAGWGAR